MREPFQTGASTAIFPEQAERIITGLLNDKNEEAVRDSPSSRVVELAQNDPGTILGIQRRRDTEAVVAVHHHAINPVGELQVGEHLECGVVVRTESSLTGEQRIWTKVGIGSRAVGIYLEVDQAGVVQITVRISTRRVREIRTVQPVKLFFRPGQGISDRICFRRLVRLDPEPGFGQVNRGSRQCKIGRDRREGKNRERKRIGVRRRRRAVVAENDAPIDRFARGQQRRW